MTQEEEHQTWLEIYRLRDELLVKLNQPKAALALPLPARKTVSQARNEYRKTVRLHAGRRRLSALVYRTVGNSAAQPVKLHRQHHIGRAS